MNYFYPTFQALYLHYVLHADHAILREGAVVTALAIFCNSHGYTVILEAFVFLFVYEYQSGT